MELHSIGFIGSSMTTISERTYAPLVLRPKIQAPTQSLGA